MRCDACAHILHMQRLRRFPAQPEACRLRLQASDRHHPDKPGCRPLPDEIPPSVPHAVQNFAPDLSP